jgi:hypothetical protein
MSTPSPEPEAPARPPPAPKKSPLSALLLLLALGASYLALQATPLAPYMPGNEGARGVADLLDALLGLGSQTQGHADFGDGRKLTCPKAFARPASKALYHVNVNLGNGGCVGHRQS